MTLKNSFLASLKENNKRRIWLWIVSVFGFVLLFPSGILMLISQHTNRYDYFIESYGEALGARMLHESLIGEISHVLNVGNGSEIWLLVAGFAILSGVQGFSYLFNKRKIDFYMGMPVKRKKRFLVIWLNGVLVYAIPSLLGFIISLMIVAANGALTGEIMLGAWQTYGILLCLYLGVYHLVILAVMLTGNIIITGFAIGVLFLYECIVRLIIMGYMETFYKFYSYRGYSTNPILSPFTILFDYQYAYANQKGNIWLTILYLLLFAAAAGTLAYFCYLKRPAEAAGRAIAFSGPKPVLKVMIAVAVALMAGLFAGEIVGYQPLYGQNNCGVMFFVMAVALIFTCCLMQVIYEFDIRGILHKKHHVVISAILVVVIFIVFKNDAFGFDRYIPNADKVESAAICTPADNYIYYGNEFWDEDMNYISKEAYVEEFMYLSDIGAVNQLMKRSMELVEEYENMNQLYEDEERQWRRVTVTYRMADKRKVCRELMVDLADEETVDLIDRIESSEEYIAGGIFGASDIPAKTIADENRTVQAYYGNGTYQIKIKKEEAKELLALYREDVMNGGFLEYRESVPTGSLCLELEEKKSYYTAYNQAELLIYPFYEKCIAYLNEKGYYMPKLIKPEDVEKIQVINEHYDLVEAARKQQDEDTALMSEVVISNYSVKDINNEFRKIVTYDKTEDITAILDRLYSTEQLYATWHNEKQCDNNYNIKVYFTSESGATAVENEGFGYYVFARGEVPEFVETDTVYVP